MKICAISWIIDWLRYYLQNLFLNEYLHNLWDFFISWFTFPNKRFHNKRWNCYLRIDYVTSKIHEFLRKHMFSSFKNYVKDLKLLSCLRPFKTLKVFEEKNEIYNNFLSYRFPIPCQAEVRQSEQWYRKIFEFSNWFFFL